MKYTLKNDMSLLEAILEAYKGISKQKAKQILTHHVFMVNGNPIRKHPQTTIEGGKTLEIIDKKMVLVPNKRNKFVIYFEDEYYIVALKPAGILAANDIKQPHDKSFHKELEDFLSDKQRKKIRLWAVHRLDRQVEGLIIFAKTALHQELIKENWERVTKKYLALTERKPEKESGMIESWLLENNEQKVLSFQTEQAGSKFARTEYRFIKPVKKFSLLEIILHTGRKNQIRAHLAQIQCPIVGDRKYGADATFNRQIRLAAYQLEFQHPVTLKRLRFEYQPATRFFNPQQLDENYKVF